MTLIFWTLLACGEEETACDDATITLESIASDPKDMAGTTGIACGAIFHGRTDGITNDCSAPDTGIGDAQVREGTYAIWPSSWGLVRNGFSVGVAVLGSDGSEVTRTPDDNEGDTIAFDATVRYDTIYDACSHSLFHSAYLELAAEDVGLE